MIFEISPYYDASVMDDISKSTYSLSKIFPWGNFGQSVWFNCPTFFISISDVRCALFILVVEDKIQQKNGNYCGRIAHLKFAVKRKVVQQIVDFETADTAAAERMMPRETHRYLATVATHTFKIQN